MTFLHPILLGTGLALVAVPILIHLLMRRRRKPVQWGAMRFLLEAYRKQRKRTALEQILLLASRCLLVALLAVAIARPLLGAAPTGGGARTLVILLDNSLTSALTDDAGVSDLDKHKALAAEALARLDTARGDRAALVTLAAPADPVVLPPSPDIAAVARVVEGVEPADSALDLAAGVEMVDLALAGSDTPAPSLLVLSSFREGADIGRDPLPPAETAFESLLVSAPDTGARTNVTITDVRPMRPLVLAGASGGPLGVGQVRVALRRSGQGVGDRASTGLRLFADGSPPLPLGSARVRWEPGQSEASVLVTLDPDALAQAAGAGESAVLLAETDPDALTRDDTRRRALEVREALRVAIVAPGRFASGSGIDAFAPADWVRLALLPGEASAGAGLRVESVEPGATSATKLAGVDAAIVTRPDLLDEDGWRVLAAFERRGGLLVVCPPPDAGAQLWIDRFVRTLDLPLTIDREARTYRTPMGVRAPESSDDSLLSMISGELDELARPVRVTRLLPLAPEPGRDDDVRTLLSVEDSAPLVVAVRPGDGSRGLVILFASSIDPGWTDLPTKPLLVPLLQELVRQGAGRARGEFSTVAGARASAPSGAVALEPIGGAPTLTLDDSARTREPARIAGAWTARAERGDRRGIIVVNPNPQAGRADAGSRESVEQRLAALAPSDGIVWLGDGSDGAGAPGFARTLRTAGSGSDLAWMVLVAALLLALVEIALGRLGSHAEATSGGALRGAGA